MSYAQGGEQLSAAIAELAAAVGGGFANVDRQFTTNRRLEAIETRLGQLEVKRRR